MRNRINIFDNHKYALKFIFKLNIFVYNFFNYISIFKIFHQPLYINAIKDETSKCNRESDAISDRSNEDIKIITDEER